MKIAAVDLETYHLEADLGRVLCASFCPITSEGKVEEAYTIVRPVRLKDRWNDIALVKAIRDEIEKYHLIVTWNGKLFDIPYLNARLLQANERKCEPQMHLDMMWYAAGNSAKLRSRKLDNVAKFFGVQNKKTETGIDIHMKYWEPASTGDKEAMQYLVDHCEADVKVLSEVYWKLLPGVRNIHRGG